MSEHAHIVCPHCDAINRLPVSRLDEGGKCGKCGAPLFNGEPWPLSEARFSRHIERSDIPVLVDFWAAWCGPCQMMAPAFAEAADRLDGEVRLVKVNTEEAQNLAGRLGIRSIPTIALFKGGKEIARTAGAMGADAIVAWTRQNLG